LDSDAAPLKRFLTVFKPRNFQRVIEEQADSLSVPSDRSKFVMTLAYGRLSSLEIVSAMVSGSFDFSIVNTSDKAMLIECDMRAANFLINRMGGSYKIAKVCGNTIEDLLEEMLLPEEAKFNWTVSGYDCDTELLEETQLSVQAHLKSRSLGKSRFMEPNVETEEYRKGSLSETERPIASLRELKIKDLYESILFPHGKTPVGLDVVVVNGLADDTLFGYTVGASDVLGFEKRDFSRSYQDPTVTIGPRLGRVLVNLAMNKSGGTLLDPFCGLGTILQEGLITGRNIVGVDISHANINKSRTNLNWIQTNYESTRKLKATLMRADAMNLRKENLPRIDGIATEPILLPKFERNPTSTVANECLGDVANLYERSLKVFRELLDRKSRIAIISPVIIDDRGREHKLQLGEMMKGTDLRLFSPTAPGLKSEYPFRVPTTKRKIIQRDVYVMTAG
jgi:tRNA G10  N-methylase Trm11